MKLAFISNYYNHHQAPISNKFFEVLNSNYYFISTEKMDEERINLGWDNSTEAFVKRTFLEEEKTEISQIIATSDIVIMGNANDDIIEKRKKEGKLIFRYSERLFKNWIMDLKFFKWKKVFVRLNPENIPLYLLAAGAYAYNDFFRMNLFINKAYKWGYFPKTYIYDDIDNIIKEKNKKQILWCGRFLDWKHPDDVIKAAKVLKNKGYNFNIKMIGTGPLETKLRNMVKRMKLEGFVQIIDALPPEIIRAEMIKSGIFLFTSDRYEGWGAVLNESMNSGCAVVASHLIGSVPFLINKNENGLIYKSGSVKMLVKKIEYLLDNIKIQEQLGKAAYYTIADEWNESVAAKRLVKLSEEILSGNTNPDLYNSGPCSISKQISALERRSLFR